jgi:hypothetical protein
MAGLNLAEQARFESLNRRVFFLHKGNPSKTDSRAATGLAATLELTAVLDGDAIVFQGIVTNTGSATWLPSLLGIGSVNLGVHLYNEDGALINADYARASVSDGITEPGGQHQVQFRVPVPDTPAFTLGIDLVSEGVTWFELTGGELVLFSFR